MGRPKLTKAGAGSAAPDSPAPSGISVSQVVDFLLDNSSPAVRKRFGDGPKTRDVAHQKLAAVLTQFFGLP